VKTSVFGEPQIFNYFPPSIPLDGVVKLDNDGELRITHRVLLIKPLPSTQL
jgi:hypothetical protein